MKKVVITFGLIGGLVVAILMGINITFFPYLEIGEVLGYSSMIIALTSVFFGIKSYRDNHQGGSITFGRAFLVGLYISLIASAVYAAGWEIYYNTTARDFMANYTAHTLEKEKAEGATEAEIAERRAEMDKMTEWYKNPVVRFGWSLFEILPVALLITLISAALLRKKEFLAA
jgi:hypothetical protein